MQNALFTMSKAPFKFRQNDEDPLVLLHSSKDATPIRGKRDSLSFQARSARQTHISSELNTPLANKSISYSISPKNTMRVPLNGDSKASRMRRGTPIVKKVQKQLVSDDEEFDHTESEFEDFTLNSMRKHRIEEPQKTPINNDSQHIIPIDLITSTAHRDLKQPDFSKNSGESEVDASSAFLKARSFIDSKKARSGPISSSEEGEEEEVRIKDWFQSPKTKKRALERELPTQHVTPQRKRRQVENGWPMSRWNKLIKILKIYQLTRNKKMFSVSFVEEEFECDLEELKSRIQVLNRWAEARRMRSLRD